MTTEDRAKEAASRLLIAITCGCPHSGPGEWLACEACMEDEIFPAALRSYGDEEAARLQREVERWRDSHAKAGGREAALKIRCNRLRVLLGEAGDAMCRMKALVDHDTDLPRCAANGVVTYCGIDEGETWAGGVMGEFAKTLASIAKELGGE